VQTFQRANGIRGDVQTQYVTRKWGLLGLILLAFALRVYSLGRWELWFDETASYAIAVKSIPDLLAYTRTAIQEHPPGYYLLLHFWMQRVGSSEFALRYLSVLAGVVFVPLIYRFAARLFSAGVGFWAAFVAAISPFAVSYAQEARMYTLLGLLALLSMYVFWRMLREDGWGMWWIWGGLTLAGMLTHYLFALLIIAQNAFVLFLWSGLGRRRWHWLALQGVLALGALGWSVIAPNVIHSFFAAADIATLAPGLKILAVLRGFALGDLRGERPFAAAEGVITAVPWLLSLWGLYATWRWLPAPRFRKPLALVASVLIVPFLIGIPAIPVAVGRYFFVAFPAFCLAIALAIFHSAQIRSPGKYPLVLWTRVALVIGGLLLVFFYGLYYQYTIDKGVFGTLMSSIEKEYSPGEAIILTDRNQWPLATYYARRIPLPRYYIPGLPDQASEAKVRPALQEVLAQHNSVWYDFLFPAEYIDPRIVELNLNRLAFQSEKKWFANSSFVARYFRSVPLEESPIKAIRWERRIVLRRFEHSALSLPAGDALRLRFSWQRLVPLRKRYLVSLTLTDEQGHVWAKRASEPCGAWCLTTDWDTQPVRDQHALLIPADTPPGQYDLRLTWYERDGGRPLEAVDERGTDLGTSIRLARVTVQEPPASAIPPRPPVSWPAAFANGLDLGGYGLPIRVVRPGDQISLQLYWTVRQTPTTTPQLVLEWVNDRGQVLDTMTEVLGTPAYPPTRWPAGRTVRSHVRITIPPTFKAGRLFLRLGLRTADGHVVSAQWQKPMSLLGGLLVWSRSFTGDTLPLTELQVQERAHTFTPPAIRHPVTATLGSQVELLGYDLPCADRPCTLRPGQELPLTLIWRAQGPTDRRYKVFTHLVGPQGKLWGQRDDEPALGTAPTTTWVAGEVISDTYRIPLDPQAPAGTYRLLVGMYHEASGQRLPAVLNGSRMPNDALPLAEVRVRR
jgi:hypothetical protein